MIVQKSKDRLTLQSEVPYDTLIYTWLRSHDIGLDWLVRPSRHFENPYLAWETVRKTRNPFFKEGTGFEGYFVGTYPSPDQAREKLLEIGRGMLESNRRLYPYDYNFRSRLMKTLVGELSDAAAINHWAALLGATLGRLRMNIYGNPKADQFRAETYHMIKGLPPMRYEQHDHDIDQQYVLPLPNGNIPFKPDIDLNLLKPSDQDAGLVVLSIGRFGHPLIREYLLETCKP